MYKNKRQRINVHLPAQNHTKAVIQWNWDAYSCILTTKKLGKNTQSNLTTTPPSLCFKELCSIDIQEYSTRGIKLRT